VETVAGVGKRLSYQSRYCGNVIVNIRWHERVCSEYPGMKGVLSLFQLFTDTQFRIPGKPESEKVEGKKKGKGGEKKREKKLKN
jgi:hypothetical protein